MKIAYVLNTYPAPSHSFIRREVQALERHGLTIHRIAMRPFDGPLADPGDRAEAAQTDYVLAGGARGLMGAVARQALAQPLGVARALGQAVRMGWRSDVGTLKHLVYWAEAAAVARRAAALGADRLHAHFGTNAASVAMLARTMGAPPYSFTVHGPEEFDKPGQIALAAKLKGADFAVAVSSFGRSQLARLLPPRLWAKLHVVHCGIEPARFADPQPVPDRRPLRLACIGRFAEQKGHPTLIAALAKVAARDVPVEVVLIGDGELKKGMERQITHHGLQGRIRLTGWLPEAGVRAELDAAHGLILPSFAEGLPMVVMEAMAAGRPVIATWVAGVPELVTPGLHGWLVPPGDDQALADAMVAMATTPNDQLCRMGKSARARALSRHTVDTEAGKLARLFAQRPRTQPD